MLEVLGPRREISICLQSDHSKLAFEGVKEEFATVNHLLDSELYQIRVFDCVEALISLLSLKLQTDRAVSCIFVGSTHTRWRVAHALCSPLRHLLQASRRIGLVASGVFLAAETGVLIGQCAAIHPNFIASFNEEFPDADVSGALHTRFGKIFTASSSISALELAFECVGQDLGRDLQQDVMQFLGAPSDCQSKKPMHIDKFEIIGRRDPVIAQCIQIMKANIEFPLQMPELAKLVSVSSRQIERKFKAYVGMTPLVTYKIIRLNHAKKLLHQTKLSTLEIGLSSGFSAASFFSKSYREVFGMTPKHDRGPNVNIYIETLPANIRSAA